MKILNRKNQKGFTLVELLIAMVILAILVASVYTLQQKAKESSTTKIVNDDLRLLDGMILEVRGPSGFNMTGLNVDEVVGTDKSNKLRRDDGLGGFDLIIADNFPVTSIAAATSLTANDSYAATIDGFDDQQCSDIVRNLWPIYNSLAINGTIVKANSSVQMDNTTSTAVNTNCAQLETNGLANVIVLTKRISG